MSIFDAIPKLAVDALAIVGVVAIVALLVAHRVGRDMQRHWGGA